MIEGGNYSECKGLRRKGGGVTLQGLTTYHAEFVPYTNKLTGDDDPMIVFAPGRFIHMSTCRRYGWVVRDERGRIMS